MIWLKSFVALLIGFLKTRLISLIIVGHSSTVPAAMLIGIVVGERIRVGEVVVRSIVPVRPSVVEIRVRIVSVIVRVIKT